MKQKTLEERYIREDYATQEAAVNARRPQEDQSDAAVVSLGKLQKLESRHREDRDLEEKRAMEDAKEDAKLKKVDIAKRRQRAEEDRHTDERRKLETRARELAEPDRLYISAKADKIIV